jgi:hypothetical protein
VNIEKADPDFSLGAELRGDEITVWASERPPGMSAAELDQIMRRMIGQLLVFCRLKGVLRPATAEEFADAWGPRA